MTDEEQVLRDTEDFSPRYRRLIAALLRRAIQNGQLHERSDSWLQQTIADGQARAVVANQSLIGFFAIRPLADRELGQIVYGSACIWRTREADIEQRVHAAVLSESARLGTAIYGSFFPSNAAARSFYSADRGWQQITEDEFPAAMRAEVASYGSDLVLVRRDVRDC